VNLHHRACPPNPGPLVRTGGGGWHFYLAPAAWATSIPVGSSEWTGAAATAAMSSLRPAATPGLAYQWVPGRELATPLAEVPAPLLERLHHQTDRPAPPSSL
jgi:hypothetical protein